MKTLEELKADFTQELLDLERLVGIWPSTIEKGSPYFFGRILR